MIEIEESSGNIYLDLGITQAGEMLTKARLASMIDEIIRSRHNEQAIDGSSSAHAAVKTFYDPARTFPSCQRKRDACLSPAARTLRSPRTVNNKGQAVA